jgi:hypothetical protein
MIRPLASRYGALCSEEGLYKVMRQVHMDGAILIGNSFGAGLA